MAALATVVAMLLGLAGCSVGGTAPPVTLPPPAAAAPDLVEGLEEVLQARTDALLAGDVDGWRSVLVDDPEFVAAQEQYFDNLVQLPLALYDIEIAEDAVPTAVDGVTEVVVHERMQLDGYDAVPVERPARYTFTRNRDGVLVISGTRDEDWETRNGIDPDPWDLVPLRVEERRGVLGIFDEESHAYAADLVDSIADGVGQVRRVLPFDWDGRVVVYALSSLDVLRELDDLPGGNPDALDGVAFPVSSGPRTSELASTRFMLHPRMLTRDNDVRDRLLRHELTHVAMGPRDDRVPIWLSEGLAEYVSVRPVPEHDRMISRDALSAARAGLTALPADATFNAAGSSGNYGVSWYVCEYIATTFGEAALWRLFDEMRAGDGTSEADQGAVIRRVLGIDERTLAQGAGARILATFG
ncbi:hypothetical protein [Nocardioides sp. AE5]|uniref:hypothetical protein n=1 Tax=Nocardioides sp. AE5 TaxID=2962573 RepID=UPI002882D0C5|nr:hypothetical protein [Nocardioides sp. AE5]MDT0201400.1 hypothetical protein [Nocardioides sp. AE5]